MLNKKILIFVFIFINFALVEAQNSQKYGITEVHFKLVSFLELELQAYELFQNQLFLIEATVKANQSFDANTFNMTLELPSGFILINDTYHHSNPPINESSNYRWKTSWLVNSSVVPGIYIINVSESLYSSKKNASLTINPGPITPFNITVKTDKSFYYFDEIGSVFAYIFDKNGYPFNIEGECNSTIYFPNKTSTSFKDVSMIYVAGSRGEYVSSMSFKAWNVDGIYTVEMKCTKPEAYANNTFTVYSVTTTIPVTIAPQPGPSPVPSPPLAPTKIVNFTVDLGLLKVLLVPGKTEKRIVKVSNVGNEKIRVTARIHNLEQFSSFEKGTTQYNFTLDVNETEEVEIDFFAKKDQEPGIYPGKIVFTGDSIERVIVTVVEVESEKPLFDVKVEVLPEYKTVFPSERVLAQLTIYNLGKKGRVDVNLEYGIKDLSGNVIATENETLAVETQVSVVKAIDIPSKIKPDSYIFYSTVSYNNVIGTGSDVFFVKERVSFKIPIYLLLILIIFILLLIWVATKLRKKKRKKKKR